MTDRGLEAVPLFSGIRPSLVLVPSVGFVLGLVRLLVETGDEFPLMRLFETDLVSYLSLHATSGAQACLSASQTRCPYSA